MPRLYREAPLNSIWEGSGNVICLDILRTLYKEPRATELFFAELDLTHGANRHLDRAIADLKKMIDSPDRAEAGMRRVVERMALCMQAALLVQYAPATISDLFCATRLGADWGYVYGTLPAGQPLEEILDRVWAG